MTVTLVTRTNWYFGTKEESPLLEYAYTILEPDQTALTSFAPVSLAESNALKMAMSEHLSHLVANLQNCGTMDLICRSGEGLVEHRGDLVCKLLVPPSQHIEKDDSR